MTDFQYSLALTITFIPYIVVEIPASLVVKRIGANKLLPVMTTLWGLITTLQGFVTSYPGLLAARFCLGLVEGGLLPGVMLVMSRFYKRDQMQLRLALFFTAASLTGAFSGLLATPILTMDGLAGHKGWQWIFILVRYSCIPLSVSFFFLTAPLRLMKFYRRRGLSPWLSGYCPSSFSRGPPRRRDFSLSRRKKPFTSPWNKIGRPTRKKRHSRGAMLSLRSKPRTWV